MNIITITTPLFTSTMPLTRYNSVRHADTVQVFRDGYIWDFLRQRSPEFAARVASQTSCTVLRGDFGDCPTLDYLRETIGLITHMLDNGGVAVYDPQMFHWWTPNEWQERVYSPGGPVPRNHTVILTSNADGNTEWIHTRGLRKFGRPDLSIPGVSPEWREGAIDLCNRFIEFQAFGGLIPERQPVRMASVPPGLLCHHGGDLDDPNFNNFHVSIHR